MHVTPLRSQFRLAEIVVLQISLCLSLFLTDNRCGSTGFFNLLFCVGGKSMSYNI